MLIKNGRIHDGLGNVAHQDLRMEDGMIRSIGADLAPLPGEEVFDAAGMEVMPGFVQPISIWGVNGSMTEIRPSSNDNDERSNPIMPELDGFYAFNGRAATYQQLGAFGLTCCGVGPTDNNLFGGTIAMFCVDGVNPYRMCLKRSCGMMASVTSSLKRTYGARPQAPQTRMWIFANFDLQLRKAAEYKEEADKPKDDKLLALKQVVDGELPLFVSCDSANSARQVWDILQNYPKVKLVLLNGFGLTGEEDWIVEHKIPVIVRVASNPLDKDAMTLDWNGIAKLWKQGVPVAFSGTYTNSLGAREDMIWNGIEMMKVLHDSAAVLPMLTSVPAKLMGVDDITGSLREGLRADVVIWSANPLESYQAHIVRTYQAGQVIYQEGDAMKCM
ncbi:amidohydrolase family protein [Pseudoflavonifractor sp. CLA-AP-H29]|uniref:Amidohydrolase family protein n=1 Tax=Pseudoflavonifractor intestinihominis TaxID=3133171 RepID=A0ABV1EBF0_9FIRM